MSACTNCGHPVKIGLRNASLAEPHVVTIDWDDTHTSPPIGPLSYQDARDLATQIRKGLKKNQHPWQGRVRISRIAEPSTALSWAKVSEGDR